MIKEKEITILEKEYFDDLKKIKETIRTNQNKAMVVVNNVSIINNYKRQLFLIRCFTKIINKLNTTI